MFQSLSTSGTVTHTSCASEISSYSGQLNSHCEGLCFCQLDTPVLAAVKTGQTSILNMLLAFGVDFSLDQNGESVAHAVRHGFWSLATLLISNGAPFPILHPETPIPSYAQNGQDRGNVDPESLLQLSLTEVGFDPGKISYYSATDVKSKDCWGHLVGLDCLPDEPTTLERIILADSLGEADLFELFQIVMGSWLPQDAVVSSLFLAQRRYALLLCSRYSNVKFVHWLLMSMKLSCEWMHPRVVTSVDVLATLFDHGLAKACELKLIDLRYLARTCTLDHIALYCAYGANPNADDARFFRELCSGTLPCQTPCRVPLDESQQTAVDTDRCMEEIDIVSYLCGFTNIDLEAHGHAALRGALSAGRNHLVRVLLDYGVDPFHAFSLDIENRVPHPERITGVACTLSFGFEQPAVVDTYPVQEVGMNAWIRIRADVDRMRLTEAEFNEIIWDIDTTVVQCLREVVRYYAGGRIQYWFEDTVVAVETVVVVVKRDQTKSIPPEADVGYSYDHLGEAWQWEEVESQYDENTRTATPWMVHTVDVPITSVTPQSVQDIQLPNYINTNRVCRLLTPEIPSRLGSIDPRIGHATPSNRTIQPSRASLLGPIMTRVERLRRPNEVFSGSPRPASRVPSAFNHIGRLNTAVLLAGIQRRAAMSVPDFS